MAFFDVNSFFGPAKPVAVIDAPSAGSSMAWLGVPVPKAEPVKIDLPHRGNEAQLFLRSEDEFAEEAITLTVPEAYEGGKLDKDFQEAIEDHLKDLDAAAKKKRPLTFYSM